MSATSGARSLHNLSCFPLCAIWGVRWLTIGSDAEAFDWYQRWSGLQPVLEPYLQKKHKILMIGCGNSSTSPIALRVRSHSLSAVSKDMHEAGYTDIVNIDISSVVINKMKEKHPELNCTPFFAGKNPTLRRADYGLHQDALR